MQRSRSFLGPDIKRIAKGPLISGDFEDRTKKGNIPRHFVSGGPTMMRTRQIERLTAALLRSEPVQWPISVLCWMGLGHVY